MTAHNRTLAGWSLRLHFGVYSPRWQLPSERSGGQIWTPAALIGSIRAARWGPFQAGVLHFPDQLAALFRGATAAI